MKLKSHICVFALTAAYILTSCGGNGKKTDNDSIKIVGVDSLPEIVEKEGIIGSGTSMNQLELITDKNDTVLITTNKEMVMGGVRAGDRISVIYYISKNENLANVAVNLTALEHVWTQIGLDGHRQSLELDANGVAVTYAMNVEYDRWELKNGFLLLHTPQKTVAEKNDIVDTFQIMKLDDQELVLANHNVETIFTMDN